MTRVPASGGVEGEPVGAAGRDFARVSCGGFMSRRVPAARGWHRPALSWPEAAFVAKRPQPGRRSRAGESPGRTLP